MDTIVKVLNEKVADGDAKTIVEALKQIDPNAEGETVAEVLKNMELGGGGGGLKNPLLTINLLLNGGAGVAITQFIMENGCLIRNNSNALEDTVYTTYALGYKGWGFAHIEGYVSAPNTSFSDLVNCTVDTEEEAIMITDPTLPASITVTKNN